MAKVKAMSRNKTIKFYHQISGLSYKECRANLKRNNWDIFQVYGSSLLDGLSDALKRVIDIFAESLTGVVDNLTACVNDTLDRVKMANAKDITEDPFTYEIKTTDDPTGEKLNKQIEYYKDLGLIGVDMSSQSDMTVYKEDF